MLFYGKSKTVSKEVPGGLDLPIGPFEILSETFSSSISIMAKFGQILTSKMLIIIFQKSEVPFLPRMWPNLVRSILVLKGGYLFRMIFALLAA